MKKLFIINVLVLIILIATTTLIYASNTTLELTGTNSINLNSTGKLTMKIASNSKIGGVMGVIEKNSKISSVKLTAKNGWNIMSYNEESGSFNMVKNEGAKNEEIMEIEYTVSGSEGTGKIEVKNITASNIENYDEEELDNVSKEITIVRQNEEGQEDTDTEEGEKEGEQTYNTDDKKSDEEKTVKDEEKEIKDQSQSSQKESETLKKSDSTASKNVLPHTGIIGVIIPTIILLLTAVSVFAYIGYKKYKGV